MLGCIVDRDLSVASDEKYISQDEIGQLCASGMAAGRLNTYLSYIREITSVLNVMADGDMRVSLHYDYNGEFAAIKSVLLGIRFYEPNAVSD